MTYTPENLIGCIISWPNGGSTWKILERPTDSFCFLLEKVRGGWDVNPPGVRVEYPCQAILSGIELGGVEVFFPDFEVLT
jgi:hypothetical protein